MQRPEIMPWLALLSERVYFRSEEIQPTDDEYVIYVLPTGAEVFDNSCRPIRYRDQAPYPYNIFLVDFNYIGSVKTEAQLRSWVIGHLAFHRK